MDEILHKNMAYKLVGIAMKVHNDLGNGYLEKVYENALMLHLKKEKIRAEQQKKINVIYLGEIIGHYIADILVEEDIILEIKVTEKITEVHVSQVLNYLKTTGKRLGIIINFKNEKLEYKRVVL
ncbi:GxxExxY protein [uncultured Ilyobacter sp.]|uniref:GxxExxY protein n=1 Tax=uncultured Ilyobacter sp. TaxID=544433 RepID=UPI0029F4CCCF|nr:GxxExxY protein [uncultured Ilyobacter sp.]